ncbi:MAG: hypothetical protein C0396_02080 [Anaerolinea sp.]|nr:hypothetical protein [Anaerolinea sp.]
MKRAEILQSVKNNPEVSVLILGGGVNGIGVFRDLAHHLQVKHFNNLSRLIFGSIRVHFVA